MNQFCNIYVISWYTWKKLPACDRKVSPFNAIFIFGWKIYESKEPLHDDKNCGLRIDFSFSFQVTNKFSKKFSIHYILYFILLKRCSLKHCSTIIQYRIHIVHSSHWNRREKANHSQNLHISNIMDCSVAKHHIFVFIFPQFFDGWEQMSRVKLKKKIQEEITISKKIALKQKEIKKKYIESRETYTQRAVNVKEPDTIC